MIDLVKRLYSLAKHLWNTRSSEAYIKWLRKSGVKVGTRCNVMHPDTVQIDVSRPELVSIGNHVFLHRGTVIMAHDWASWCFVELHSDFIPAHRKISIGNNVWLGEYVTILAGVTVGDNVVIGINSVVTKDIPSNSVAVGNPAKVVCSLDDYYEKRKKKYVDECKEFAREIIASGREPKEEDFYDDYPSFVDGHNYEEYDYPYARIFDSLQFDRWKNHHKAPYNGFSDFLKSIYEKDGNT